MVNRIWIDYSGGLNKIFSSRFCIGSRVRHETFQEGRRIYRPKHFENIYKDEVISLNISNDKTYIQGPAKLFPGFKSIATHEQLAMSRWEV